MVADFLLIRWSQVRILPGAQENMQVSGLIRLASPFPGPIKSPCSAVPDWATSAVNCGSRIKLSRDPVPR